jgi:hypothetical protein
MGFDHSGSAAATGKQGYGTLGFVGDLHKYTGHSTGVV